MLSRCIHSMSRNARLLGVGGRGYVQVSSTETPYPASKIDLTRSRLVYQSRKRGILENCIIFTTFADQHLKTFDGAQLEKYDALINSRYDEWDLYAWAIGAKPPPQEFDNDVMALLRSHVHKQGHNKK